MVNSRYGYAAGDQLLRSLYMLLKSQLDLSCSIARYGNDRFTILFTKDSLESIKAGLQKISDNYKAILHTAKHISFNSTLTYGLSTFNKGKTASQLIEEANLNVKRG